MWILFIITLAASGHESATAIAGYTSYAECKSEEDRIQAEMYTVYPNETKQFYLKCLIKAKETT